MPINMYPVTQTETATENYEIKINGIKVMPNTARVSAVPFNRRWPGHQRGKEQTELINFVSLSSDEPLEFEIKPKEPFKSVTVRPFSLNITPEAANGVIRFTLSKPAYFTVEPFGRSNALHIFVDPVCNYGANINDENVIYYGVGEHDAGMIELKNNQTLYIDEGAVVYACVRAKDAENIKIIGRGILDNSRNKEKILCECNAENNSAAVNNAVREHTVQLEYCTDIKIEGITVRDSLVYNIRPIGCKNLDISNVKLIGNWRYNSDGIDMHNCENVVIDNCFIRTFDDSVCIKGFDCYYDGDVEAAVKAAMYRNGKAYDVFKNVLVKNCTVWNDWGRCLEIGAETRTEEIKDIVFENCDIIHVSANPLDCFNVDYAYIHNVVYRNINVEYDDIIPEPQLQKSDGEVYDPKETEYVPQLISITTEYHFEYSAGGERRGKINGITLENIKLFGRQIPKIYIDGYDAEHKTENVLIKNLYYNGKLLEKIDPEYLHLGEYTENIRYTFTCSGML